MAQSKSVVITGVSTGIGHAATKVLIGQGFHVFGSVRKAADGERLKAEFGEAFTPLIFDVVDEAAVRAGARQVEAALGGKTLAGFLPTLADLCLAPRAGLHTLYISPLKALAAATGRVADACVWGPGRS